MHNIINIYRNRIRNINLQGKMGGCWAPHNRYGGCAPFFSALVLLLSVVLLGACLGDAGNNNSDRNPTAITDITITDITATTLTVSWVNPVDTVAFQGVLISADPAAGTLTMPQQQSPSATTALITDLTPLTTYSLVLISVYADSTKNSTSVVYTAMTATSVEFSIDADGDGLIDITSLDRLYNIRYNLDLSDGRYKNSATDSGVLCGIERDMNCIGYELVFDLDFANRVHYESGVVNAAWRPQDSRRTVVTQGQAGSATNAGWEPIAYGEMVTAAGVIEDVNYTPFNTLFDGKHYTVSNLYVRRRGTVGLFGGTGSAATIRSSAVVAAALYGSDNNDVIGALIGRNDGGSVIASYAEGSISSATSAMADHMGVLIGSSAGGTVTASYARGTVNGGAGSATNALGGLVGSTSGTDATTVIASYTNVTLTGGAGNNNIGGLVGRSDNIIIVAASYATGDVISGTGDDDIGGLQGYSSNLDSSMTASYATGTVDGGRGTGTRGLVVGMSAGSNFIRSFGFGADTIVGATNTVGYPTPAANAAALTAANSGPQWHNATNLTLDAWDFGTDTQAAALRYADYDGAGTEYGCGDDSNATIVIPSMVPDGMGGTIPVVCGTTLLPGQGR